MVLFHNSIGKSGPPTLTLEMQWGFLQLSGYMFVQNFIKPSAAVYELSC